MPNYEYKVVPAPEKARKVRGLKGPALFAHALEDLMNEFGAEGWSYLRAETLPQEERAGLTSRTTTYRNLLVFQREIPDEFVEDQPEDSPQPQALDEPEPDVDEADEAENFWTGPDADTPPEPLFPNRQGQRVDL